MEPIINRTVLMSDAEHFDTANAIDPYMKQGQHANRSTAAEEFEAIKQALAEAGVTIRTTPSPPGSQDGIFTANWAVVRGDTAVLSHLPPPRMPELRYAEAALRGLGKRIIKAPHHFSGQGDALPCGDLLFANAGFRTDERMHDFLASELGYQVVSLRTVPELDAHGRPVINRVTGWPDSLFYDLDLALCVLRRDLIGWCPEAFTPDSQAKIRALPGIGKIEISRVEAVHGFACNSVSTGSTVIMNPHAPDFRAAAESHSLRVLTVDAPELAKGGGGIRCTTLTMDNE